MAEDLTERSRANLTQLLEAGAAGAVMRVGGVTTLVRRGLAEKHPKDEGGHGRAMARYRITKAGRAAVG